MTKQDLINKIKGIDPSFNPLNLNGYTLSTITGAIGLSSSSVVKIAQPAVAFDNIPIEDYIKLINFQLQFENSFNELNKLLEKYPNFPALVNWDISKYVELFDILLNKIDTLTLEDFKFMVYLPLNIIELFIQKNKDNIKNINLSHLEFEQLEYLHLKYFV